MNQESWLEAEVDEGRREEEEDEQSREERDLRAPILFFTSSLSLSYFVCLFFWDQLTSCGLKTDRGGSETVAKYSYFKIQ